MMAALNTRNKEDLNIFLLSKLKKTILDKWTDIVSYTVNVHYLQYKLNFFMWKIKFPMQKWNNSYGIIDIYRGLASALIHVYI